MKPSPEQREIIKDVLRCARRQLQGLKLDVQVRPGRADAMGEAWVDRGTHRIWVAGDVEVEMFRYLLVHELAHAVAGEYKDPEGHHGARWGVAFASIYRAVYEPRKGRT